MSTCHKNIIVIADDNTERIKRLKRFFEARKAKASQQYKVVVCGEDDLEPDLDHQVLLMLYNLGAQLPEHVLADMMMPTQAVATTVNHHPFEKHLSLPGNLFVGRERFTTWAKHLNAAKFLNSLK